MKTSTCKQGKGPEKKGNPQHGSYEKVYQLKPLPSQSWWDPLIATMRHHVSDSSLLFLEKISGGLGFNRHRSLHPVAIAECNFAFLKLGLEWRLKGTKATEMQKKAATVLTSAKADSDEVMRNEAGEPVQCGVVGIIKRPLKRDRKMASASLPESPYDTGTPVFAN